MSPIEGINKNTNAMISVIITTTITNNNNNYYYYYSVIYYVLNSTVDRDISDSVATGLGLDGSGIESRWRRDFPHPSRPALGPIRPTIQRSSGLFPRGKAGGSGFTHQPPSSAEVKERLELHRYSPSGTSWSLLE
jgi:hypothetical protein